MLALIRKFLPTIALPAPRALPVANTQARVESLDAARVLASVGVVWFHATCGCAELGPSGVLGKFSVPFYTLLTMHFLVDGLRRHPERTWMSYVQSRFWRLYVPFLAWSLIAALVHDLAHLIDPSVATFHWDRDIWIAGTSVQLWFLPFALVASALAFPIARAMITHPKVRAPLALGCIALAVGLEAIDWPNAPLSDWPIIGRFLELSWNRWSAVYLGLAMAILYMDYLQSPRSRRTMAMVGLALTAFICLFQAWIFPDFSLALKLMAGLGWWMWAFGPWKLILPGVLKRLGAISFGIYLAHVPFITLGRVLAESMDFPVSPMREISIFAFATLSSILLAGLLTRSEKTRWLMS